MAGLDTELAEMSDTADRADLTAVARGGALNLVGAAVAALAGLVLTVAVTRLVPQSTAGVFFTVTSLFVLLVAVGQLGSDTGLVYFVARARTLDRPGQLRGYLRTAIRPAVTVATVAAVALALSAGPLAHLLAAEQHALATGYLRQVAVFLPLAVLANLCLAATRGYGTMRPTTLVEKLSRPLAQIAAVSALAISAGELLVAGWALPYLPAAAVACWWLVRVRRRHPDTAVPTLGTQEGSVAREYWGFTLPRAFAAVGQLALQRLDILIVAALRGPVDAAIYTAATRFLVVGQLANQAISMAVQPRIAGLLATDDADRANQVYRSSTAWLVLLAWPLYLLVAGFASTILLLFGDAYVAGGNVVVVLCLAMLAATACGMVDVMLNMAGRTSWNLANVTVAVVVNVGLNLLLVPAYGIIGAAVSWAVAIVLKNLLPLVQIWRTLGLHPFDRASCTAMALAGGWFGLLPASTSLLAGPGLATALLTAGTAVVGYLGSLWGLSRTLHLDLLVQSLRRPRG